MIVQRNKWSEPIRCQSGNDDHIRFRVDEFARTLKIMTSEIDTENDGDESQERSVYLGEETLQILMNYIALIQEDEIVEEGEEEWRKLPVKDGWNNDSPASDPAAGLVNLDMAKIRVRHMAAEIEKLQAEQSIPESVNTVVDGDAW